MAHMENQRLINDVESFPKLYLRHIDDIFLKFDDDQPCTGILKKLNIQRFNVSFTLEQGERAIPFLKVGSKINRDIFDTWTLKKPSNTGLMLNFNAFCPKFSKKRSYYMSTH